MRVFPGLVSVLAACTHAVGVDDSAPADDSAHDSTTDSSVDDTALEPTACPEGMVPVPAAHPLYCIDAYEVSVVNGVATALAGVLPTNDITFDDAVAACAATPVVNGAGAVVGYRHLATSSEWQDAADGVVGEGGTAFPYGDTWQDGVCATLDADGSQPVTQTQLTGAFPGCVSAFGTYDQVGNLHEWMDPGFVVDAALAEARFATLAVPITVGADGGIYVGAGDPSALVLQVTTAVPGNVKARDGRLYVAPDEVNWQGEAEGYLTVRRDLPSAGWYPVQLAPMDDGSGYWINDMPANDGAPIPDKRGCSYYAGVDSGCDVGKGSYFHTHDFWGSVGFRCASAPFVP